MPSELQAGMPALPGASSQQDVPRRPAIQEITAIMASQRNLLQVVFLGFSHVVNWNSVIKRNIVKVDFEHIKRGQEFHSMILLDFNTYFPYTTEL